MSDPHPPPMPSFGQRVAVLVDTGDLYHSARQRFSGRIDYRLLLERIVGRRALVRAVAFVVRTEDVDVTPFVDALRGAGFEPRVKVLKRRPDGGIRGDQHVGLALMAAALAERVDAVAIASGSEDLTEVLDFLRARGVRAEIYAVDGQASPAVVRAADEAISMDESWMLPNTRRALSRDQGATRENVSSP